MKGRDLIPVAELLSKGRPPTEPMMRSAVSRSYYAAFGELGNYLRMRHYTPPAKRSSHDAAWNHLQSGIRDFDKDRGLRRRAVAGVGLHLKARRQKADYQLNAGLRRDEAALAVEEAKRIVSELDALDAAAPAI
jgi:hypothetical protein